MRDHTRNRTGEPNKLEETEKNTIYHIKESKPIHLKKDFTIDLISDLVRKKVYTNTTQNTSKSPTKTTRAQLLRIIIPIVISVIMLGVIIYTTFFHNRKKSTTPFSVDDIDILQFDSVPYYGKDDMIVAIVSKLLRMLALIEKKDYKLLSAVLSSTKKNYLLHGAPGTGKTQFIKKVVYKTNYELKIQEYIATHGEYITKEIFKDTEKFLYEIKKAKNQVKFITLKPSDLNSKYVGETEQNLRREFQRAKEYTKTYKLVLIFIDEVESFFSERKKDTTEHGQNSKSEFLTILEGVGTDLMDRIVIFAATNFIDKIDDAFLRRFPNQIEFLPPSDEERRAIVMSKNAHNTVKFSEEEITRLVYSSRGLTQNQMISVFDIFIEMNEEINFTVEFEELNNAFHEAQPGWFASKKEKKKSRPIKFEEKDKKYIYSTTLGG